MQENCVAAREEIVKDSRALKCVSPAYAGRGGALTAALQYTYQVILLGKDHAREGKELEKIAAAKLFELEKLGALIQKLGASPIFSACPPYPVSYYSASCVDYAKTLPAMLEADIRLERAAVERYTLMLAALENPAVASAVCALRAGCESNLKALEDLQRGL